MKRRSDLDFAKGIGIILMVLGHSFSAGNGDAVKVWFYSFHMPLFFIVSGILMSMKQERQSLKAVVKGKARALLLPYFLWCTLIAVYLCIMGRKSFAYFLDLARIIVSFQGLSALWFLPCLFISQLLFYGLRKTYDQNRILGWTAAGIMSILGFCLPDGSEVWKVILRACTGASFIWLGWQYAKVYSIKWSQGGYCVLCIVHLLLARLNGQVGVLDRSYGNALLFYLNALLGTWLVIQTYHVFQSDVFEKAKGFISWLGKNSIVLVCTSFFAIEFFRLLDYKAFGSLLPKLGNVEGIVLCTLAVLVEIPVILASEHFLCFAFGKRK